MKNKTKNNKKVKGTIAISQILILVIGIIAISWMIGGEIEEVSAADLTCPTTGIGTCINPTATCDGTKVSGGSGCIAPTNVCCIPLSTPPETPPKDNELVDGVVNIGGQIISTVAVNKGVEVISKKLFSPKIPPGTKTTLSPSGLAPGPNVPKVTKLSKLLHSGVIGNVIKNAVWAAATYLVINYFAKKYASQRNAGDISTVTLVGAGAGIFIGTIATAAGLGGPVGWLAGAITAFFAGVYMLVGYQIYSREIFTFRPGLWQPPVGGSDCNKCNALTIAGQNGCSKYICHSYGLACEWKNDETEYETCIEVNKGDISAPIITPAKEIWGEDVFPNDKYDYATSSAGAKIVYVGEGGGTGKCVPAFTPIKLAIKTNEDANCKIIYNEPASGATNAEKLSNMKDMAEGTSYTKNHTLKLPSIVTASVASLENAGYELTNGGNYKFYIRCEDVRGNINSMDYLMSFCVQSGPDTNPPEITGTRPAQNEFIPYQTDEIEDFQVYTNEPADCKWDFQPKSYNFMNYKFTKCSQNINQKLSGFDFGCQGNLTGFKKGVENKYYIACIDQPELKGTEKENKRNAGNPYKVVLKGTMQLLIEDVKINGKTNGTTIKDSREKINVKIEVTTFGGAEEGKARCKYSEDTTEPRAYYLFDNDNNRDYNYMNTQNLYMPNGNYKYFLQCFDVAGNMAETMINFSVEIDGSSPIVVRVFKDNDNLKIITDEEAECVYFKNLGNCNYIFEEGTKMDSLDKKEHYTEWNTNDAFYITCRDNYKNPPKNFECSIIVRPFEIFALQ